MTQVSNIELSGLKTHVHRIHAVARQFESSAAFRLVLAGQLNSISSRQAGSPQISPANVPANLQAPVYIPTATAATTHGFSGRSSALSKNKAKARDRRSPRLSSR